MSSQTPSRHRRIGTLATCIALALAPFALVQAAQTAPTKTAAAASVPADASAKALDTALAGAWRSGDHRARDAARHPAATLRFLEIQPAQTVIEITPGGGWYSEVLAPLLRDQGHYIAAVGKASDAESRSDESALQRKFKADTGTYGRAAIVEFDPGAPVLGPADSADRVLTFRNVHNWVMADTAPAMFKAFFAVLKPGGMLGVIEHRAADGAALESVRKSGYLPTAYVTKLATDAGFKLVASSEINANPRDTKDYAKGVWTLPPTFALGKQDKAKYAAIGESDRMTLRFVKPMSGESPTPAR